MFCDVVRSIAVNGHSENYDNARKKHTGNFVFSVCVARLEVQTVPSTPRYAITHKYTLRRLIFCKHICLPSTAHVSLTCSTTFHLTRDDCIFKLKI
jgi:hypothetical protein